MKKPAEESTDIFHDLKLLASELEYAAGRITFESTGQDWWANVRWDRIAAAIRMSNLALPRLRRRVCRLEKRANKIVRNN